LTVNKIHSLILQLIFELLIFEAGFRKKWGIPAVRNAVAIWWRFRLLVSAEWWVHRGGKRGNKGGEERFPATALHCPPPLFPPLLASERAPFRERSERNPLRYASLPQL